MVNYSTIAYEHTDIMDKTYTSEITDSIQKSEIFRRDTQFREKVKSTENPKKFIAQSKLVDTDSVNAAFAAQGQRIALLNFADYKNPGGLFLNGSLAQEEYLCHCSFLYNVLEKFDIKYYKPNRADTNHALYTDSAIYSPNIKFWNAVPGQIFSDPVPPSAHFDVITCAAPNAKSAKYYYDELISTIVETMKERICFIKEICQIKQVDTLIAGAFGCGVFANDPSFVARAFKEIFTKSNSPYPSLVIHPIPSKLNSNNFYQFRRIFNQEILNENDEIIGWQ